MGLISKRSIDEVLDKAQIEDVVLKFVPDLKKTGSNYQAKSPWSSEKTPSFFVVPKKGIFKDFSTGKGGNVLTFLMEMGNSYPEAIRYLAEMYNITIQEDEDHSLTEEEKNEIASKRENTRKLVASTQRRFRNNLAENKDAWQYLLNRGLTDEDIIDWQIGFGGDLWDGITKDVINAGLQELAVEIGICWKEKKTVDAYRNRITIPITDKRGNIVGWGGRIVTDEKPKYINPREYDGYHKENILFGLDRAQKAIRFEEKCYLTEGYLDVISMHRAAISNVVATCGTALCDGHIKELKKSGAKRIVVITDGDAAGERAAEKMIPLIVAAGLVASVIQLPDGKDPHDMVLDGWNEDSIKSMEKDADGIIWLFAKKYEDGSDAVKVEKAVDELCQILASITSQTKRDYYINQIVKKFGINKGSITKQITNIEKDKNEKEAAEKLKDVEDVIDTLQKVDRDFYGKYGFVEHQGVYKFYRDEEFHAGTNFVIKPLFHINNKKDDRRLMELIRPDRRSTIVEIPSAAMVSKNTFQTELFKTPGNFNFLPGLGPINFQQIMLFIAEEMPVAKPLITLGQQPEGFCAFANGITTGREFQFIDKYGIVEFDDVYINADGEEVNEKKHFFLPAYSALYKNVRIDEDEYENERKFKMVKSRITLKEYFQLFEQSFGKDKSIIGLSFLVASAFRDVFLSKYSFFPLLFAYGEKGSGKSVFCQFIQNFFFVNQDPFMLNAGTEVGFFRRLARVRNAANFFDEFTDHIDENRFQALKSAWNGVGREKGMLSGDNRTEISKVNSSVIIGGQYLSTRDDNALTSRAILVPFQKQDRTKEGVDAFYTLQKEIEHGVNSLLIDIIKHREFFIANIEKEYQSITQRIREDLSGRGTMDRHIVNYGMLLAPVKMLGDALGLPFTYSELYAKAIESIQIATSIMVQSEDVGTFWQIIEDLIENNELLYGADYVIQRTPHLAIDGGETWSNNENCLVLIIRFSRAHGLYMKEFKKRTSSHQHPTEQTTLAMGLKSRPYFIGSIKSYRFQAKNTSAFAFNYDQMINLGYTLQTEKPVEPKEGSRPGSSTSQPITQVGVFDSEPTKDDLPF